MRPWGPHSSFPSPGQNSRENNLRRVEFSLAHNFQRFLLMATDLVSFGLRKDVSKMAMGTCGRGCSFDGSQEMEQTEDEERREEGRDRRPAPM